MPNVQHPHDAHTAVVIPFPDRRHVEDPEPGPAAPAAVVRLQVAA